MRSLRNASASAAAITIRVVIASLLLLSGGCGRSSDAPEQRSGASGGALQGPLVLRRGLGGEPGTLDPQKADDTFAFEILRDMYEGLTVSSPSGEVVAGTAESWVVDSTGRTYTFKLRPDARWSDGSAVTADQFVAGLRRAVDPSTASPGADLLRIIVNAPDVIAGRRPVTDLAVRATDSSTIEITTAPSAPYLPDVLSNSIAYPLHPSSAKSTVPAGRSVATASNGAFVLVGNTPGGAITLRKNRHYHGAAGVRIDEVRYFPIADESTEFTRFRAGELDMTNTVPAPRVSELRASRTAMLQMRPLLATFFYSFNLERGPLSRSPELREALSLVVDREGITEKIAKAGQVPAYALVAPGVWYYEPEAYRWRTLPRDQRLRRARELYARAGYSSAKPLRLRLVYNENDLIRDVSVAVAAAWKETLGVETELKQLEYRVYLDVRDQRAEWDVLRVGWSADYNDASSFLDTMMSSSPQNHGRYRDVKFDELMTAVASEPDVLARRALLERAEAEMLAAYPILPVYYYVTRRLVQPWVHGAELNPLNRNYSRYLSIEARPEGR